MSDIFDRPTPAIMHPLALDVTQFKLDERGVWIRIKRSGQDELIETLMDRDTALRLAEVIQKHYRDYKTSPRR